MAFSYIFGSKTLFSRNISPSRNEGCTGFVATVLNKAWTEANQQALRGCSKSYF